MNIDLGGGGEREVPYFMTRLHCFFLNTENGFSGWARQLLRFSGGSSRIWLHFSPNLSLFNKITIINPIELAS